MTTFTFCLFAGVRYTADALSAERREGTVGLLFLTDLRGYDVVIGKLTITSLNAFFGVLGALPLLAVPVLIGGVSAGEVYRVMLVLINNASSWAEDFDGSLPEMSSAFSEFAPALDSLRFVSADRPVLFQVFAFCFLHSRVCC